MLFVFAANSAIAEILKKNKVSLKKTHVQHDLQYDLGPAAHVLFYSEQAFLSRVVRDNKLQFKVGKLVCVRGTHRMELCLKGKAAM